ncbi:MAG TPA: CBS domain-containing protein, partial [Gemmatimonadaceae bacterium]|nr:CBS domain-containing protein [Gemmatimonadaceae bacterium]
LVVPERVTIPLAETTLRGAALALIERLVAAGAVDDQEKLRPRVEEERGEDIVAMGDRAFLLHYRTDSVADLAVAVGVSPEPISRQIGDGEAQQARIVLVILAPPRQAARYLQVVGAFARLMSKPGVVDAIHEAATPRDLAALPSFASVALPEQLTVRDIMTEWPRTAAPDTPLRDAARDMTRARIGALPVVDRGGLLVGMLSERELLRHMMGNVLQGGTTHRPTPTGTARRTVRDVMTRQVLCVSPEQPLAEVASLMSNKDVECVPVVNEGRLVGFLSRSDIIRKLIGP